MLVERRTHIVKFGKEDEAVALLKAELTRIREAHNYTGAIRNYMSHISPFGHLIIETEWNSMGEWERFWADWGASPEAAAFLEKWVSLVDQGGGVEIWTLVE